MQRRSRVVIRDNPLAVGQQSRGFACRCLQRVDRRVVIIGLLGFRAGLHILCSGFYDGIQVDQLRGQCLIGFRRLAECFRAHGSLAHDRLARGFCLAYRGFQLFYGHDIGDLIGADFLLRCSAFQRCCKGF